MSNSQLQALQQGQLQIDISLHQLVQHLRTGVRVSESQQRSSLKDITASAIWTCVEVDWFKAKYAPCLGPDRQHTGPQVTKSQHTGPQATGVVSCLMV